ncbi:MAG: 4Fe-4S ferredoxin [Sulfuricurvum sp. PC08-66]|nr:MAG: 4Fe-4S ferredoxin [Sulfuricurvum sp. PC08-66]
MAKNALPEKTEYRIKRYWFYAFVTLFAVGIPFVTIDGAHFFLFSFESKSLHLFFNTFSMQELYLMPFLLIMLFVGIFGITVFGGRIFCGWACPQTIFRVIYRDLIETKLLGLRKRIKNKQQEPDMSKMGNKIKKVVAILLWAVLAYIASADFLWFFVAPENYFAYLSNISEHTVLFGFQASIMLFLMYDVIKLKEDFCVYVCPYSRIQSVLYDDDTIMAIYDETRGGKIYNEHKEQIVFKQKDLSEQNECTACNACVTVCPTHIDIRKGLQLECINCLECVDACTDVQGKLGAPSLVEWSSIKETEKKAGKTHYLRPKIIGYMVILVGLMVALVIVGSKKEFMLLNITKESRPYKIEMRDSTKIVSNTYEFLFENTQGDAHEFYFEIIAPEGITIARPTTPLKIAAGEKEKVAVILQTDKMLVDTEEKTTSIEVTLHAFAVDAKETILIERKAIFFFPDSVTYNSVK